MGASLPILLAIGLSLTPPAGARGVPAEKPPLRVKTMTSGVSGSEDIKGVVGSIDADGLVLVVMSGSLEVKEHTFKPTDVLRRGEMLDSVFPRFAYRWEHVKAGDTVILIVAEDHIDKQKYCMEIQIVRRPKGRLPASQLEEEDTAFPARRIVNDIDNGVDVSDEEILKVYPPKPARVVDGRKLAATPGGLNEEWQAKLDAIRAKKKDDVKAPPAEKK